MNIIHLTREVRERERGGFNEQGSQRMVGLAVGFAPCHLPAIAEKLEQTDGQRPNIDKVSFSTNTLEM